MGIPLQLCYPVHTLDGRELLPAGTYLNQETMRDLVRRAEHEDFPLLRLLEHGSIARDLRNICESPPYCQMFSNTVRRDDIFRTMERVEVVRPQLDIYDFLKKHDPYTYRHILTVFALSLLMAQELMENRQEYNREVAAATSHDFGKVCVPASVLKKSAPLDEHERQQLSHHAAAGYVLLSYFLKNPLHPAAIAARDHHERSNGSGYPRGIAQRSRMVEIIAVSDIFDALISKRPYRRISYEVRAALDELTLQAERGMIAADIVHALIGCNRRERASQEESYSLEQRGTPPAGNHYCGATRCRFLAECSMESDQ